MGVKGLLYQINENIMDKTLRSETYKNYKFDRLFSILYILQKENVCINCTDGTNESKNNPWRKQISIEIIIKWDKNEVNLYLHCRGWKWSLRVEDQSKRKRWKKKKEMKYDKVKSVKH